VHLYKSGYSFGFLFRTWRNVSVRVRASESDVRWSEITTVRLHQAIKDSKSLGLSTTSYGVRESRKEDSTSVLLYCTKVAKTPCSHVTRFSCACSLTIHCSILRGSNLATLSGMIIAVLPGDWKIRQ